MSVAEIASPLTDLTRKNARFVWSEACQKTFDTLKDSLVSAPILGMSSYKGKFILDTDASNFSIGAVLSQEQDGAYASRRLSYRERNYCITRRELLAVVQFVKHFRAYMLGRPFDIRTDHAALRWLKMNPERIGQQVRWLELLEELDYTVIHRPGNRHGNADGMSKRACDKSRCCPVEVYVEKRFDVSAVKLSDETEIPSTWVEQQQADPDVRRMIEMKLVNERAPNWHEIEGCNKDLKVLCSQFDRLEFGGWSAL